jgi:gliding motility-associated-like protein
LVSIIGSPAASTTYSIAPSVGTTNNNNGTFTVPVSSGPYTISATSTLAGACTTASTNQVSMSAAPAVPNAPTVTTPVNYCVADAAVALTATADVNHNLLWYTAATGGTGSTTAPTPDTSVAGTAFYYVSQVNNTTGCESARAAITVIVSQVTLDLTAGCIDADYTLTATAPAGATFEWYKGTNIVPEAATGNTFIVTTPETYRVVATFNGCVTDATENVTSVYCAIPKGISPNGDEFNQTFDLKNFNVKKLQIFNRYGMEVYSKEQYKNEWDGKSNDGQVLPDGTYFYVIEFESGKTKTGWVYKNSEY